VGGERLWEIPCAVKHTNDLNLSSADHEEYEIAAMACVTQACDQFVAAGKASRSFGDLDQVIPRCR
jgi:hypothetical protein